MKFAFVSLSLAITVAAVLSGCATETSKALDTPKVESANSVYNGPRYALAVGKFENRSAFLRGLFSDGIDRLGNQAKTILIGHLQQANRFAVMERDKKTLMAKTRPSRALIF